MSSLFVALCSLVASSFRTRAALQAEILALRHQLCSAASKLQSPLAHLLSYFGRWRTAADEGFRQSRFFNSHICLRQLTICPHLSNRRCLAHSYCDGGCMVTVAVPVLIGSVAEVAVTITAAGFGTLRGAV